LDESLAEHLSWLVPDHTDFRVLRQSVDARQRHRPHFVYSVEVFEGGEHAARPTIELSRVGSFGDKPVVIVGAGPAGLFAALRLCERGVPCVLLEQGGRTEERVRTIGRFWRYGELDPLSNVSFGEGGAGLFSDGKLMTRVKSEHIPYVMQRLVQLGAPPEIEFLANPHVGSDRIRRVIPRLRERLLSLGCDIRFQSQVVEILTRDRQVVGVKVKSARESSDSFAVIECDHLILACGHSAEGMFRHLRTLNVAMENKPYAVGLRIEHPQEEINRIQYREHANHPKLGAANYKLAYHDQTDQTGVYSFCMCPGGYVLSAGTEADGLVSNGMSNFNRGSRFANSAIVVTVHPDPQDLFAGLSFRRALEQRAFQLTVEGGGTKELPAQMLMDFMNRRSVIRSLESSSPSGVVPARLDRLFDDGVYGHLVGGMEKFEANMRGFISEHALLHGVESRTSCPVRVLRDPDSLQSSSHSGLYPCGEGAGYAGGITSAACDGIRVADAICAQAGAVAGATAGAVSGTTFEDDL